MQGLQASQEGRIVTRLESKKGRNPRGPTGNGLNGGLWASTPTATISVVQSNVSVTGFGRKSQTPSMEEKLVRRSDQVMWRARIAIVLRTGTHDGCFG
jgi:hypothetical protein